MATDTVEESVDAAGKAHASDTGIFSGKNLKIGLLLLTFMAAGAAVMYVFLPPPAAVDAAGLSGELEDGAAEAFDTAEVAIGQFSCTNSRAANGIIHLTFELIAVVARGQEFQFRDSIDKEHRHRVRQAVERVARSSSLEDLDDPNLSTIKRLIREEINKVLRKSYVIEVVINGFQRMEQ